MDRTARRIVRGVALLATLALVVFGWLAWRGGEIVSGYTAKMLCSCVFVSGRDTPSCLREDLGGYSGLFAARVDLSGRSVDSKALLLGKARAEYHDGLGCTLR